MLTGIVKKNAIMVVDFAIDMERAGDTTPAEAAAKGSLIRFRPIMMMPTNPKRSSCIWKSINVASAPNAAAGKPERIVSGCMKLSYRMPSTI